MRVCQFTRAECRWLGQYHPLQDEQVLLNVGEGVDWHPTSLDVDVVSAILLSRIPFQHFELRVYGYDAASVFYAGADRNVPAAHWSFSITNPATVSLIRPVVRLSGFLRIAVQPSAQSRPADYIEGLPWGRRTAVLSLPPSTIADPVAALQCSGPTMTIFRSQGPQFVPPRDDITLPQFILDDVGAESTRPVRPAHVPCLIDSETGKAVYLEEVHAQSCIGCEASDETVLQLRSRSHALARSLQARYNIGTRANNSRTQTCADILAQVSGASVRGFFPICGCDTELDLVSLFIPNHIGEYSRLLHSFEWGNLTG